MASLLRLLLLAIILTLPSRSEAVKVEVLAGVAMINWGFDVNPIGDIVTFESDASPYFARNLELRFADLWGFEGGVGYVTNQLLGAAGFTARQEIVGIDDPIASILLGNLARDIGPIRIGVSTTLRRFELQRTYRGHWIDPNLPLGYLAAEGDPQTLAKDQKLNLASEQFDLSIRVHVPVLLFFGEDLDDYGADGRRVDLYVGYHRLSYGAPLVVSVTDPDNPVTTFNNLMGSRWSAHLADIGAYWIEPPDPSEGKFGFTLRIPAQIGFATIENQYLAAGGGVSIGLGFEVAVSYGFKIGPHTLLFELGFQGDWYSSLLTDEAATIKKTIPFVDLVGQAASFGGAKGDVSVSREETVWGPFLNAAFLLDFS